MRAGALFGLNEDQFWMCTPRYFNALQKAFEHNEQFQMVLTRQASYWTILPHIDTKKRKFLPKDLGLFEWEVSDGPSAEVVEKFLEQARSATRFWEQADAAADEINARLREAHARMANVN